MLAEEMGSSTSRGKLIWILIRILCQKRGVSIQENEIAGLESMVPLLLTPGAAETLAVKTYRLVRAKCSPLEAQSCGVAPAVPLTLRRSTNCTSPPPAEGSRLWKRHQIR
jgi:hypothetical protein